MFDIKTVQPAALRSVVVVASCARASAYPNTDRILSNHRQTCACATMTLYGCSCSGRRAGTT
eukprot:3465412-Prymnesium_polylepis.1